MTIIKDETKCEVVLVGISNKVPWWWKRKKISRNSVWESEKLFWGERHPLGSGGKEKRKEKLFDLRKKAAVIKQIQLAAYAEDRKSCLQRNYKQVRANFWLLKFSMLGYTTSVAFQNFHS